MKEYSRFLNCASLAILGMMSQKMGIWAVIEQKVRIKQKKIGHAPVDKLKDAFISILCGGHGVVEVNTLVRSNPVLQQAFGRTGCAEQSSVSRALNTCTAENVGQLRQALQALYQRHAQSYRHNYAVEEQILDVDMTGLLAGKRGEGVTKGYFADARNRRGRQVGRVLASKFNEVVVDRLYPGKIQLEVCLQELLTQAEQVMDLDAERRKRTVVRVDGGGGRTEDINWVLQRGYLILMKVKNWHRTRKLLQRVQQWYSDPQHPHRQLGWVEPPFDYACPTRQLAMQETRADGRVYQAVIVTNLPDAFFFGASPPSQAPQQILARVMHGYDLRSGGVETANRNSKSGLGLNQRNKRSFAAQEMLLLLAQLAYNLLAWIHARLALAQPFFQPFGWQRLIRDVFRIPGRAYFDANHNLLRISLARDHPLAKPFLLALPGFDHLSVNLRKI